MGLQRKNVVVDARENSVTLGWMVLGIERVVELLAQSERGEVFPKELRDKRYVVLHWLDPSVMRDPPSRRDPFYKKAKAWIGLRNAREASDFEGALELLWESIDALPTCFENAEFVESTEAFSDNVP